jgi:hypothetical protein
VGLPISFLNCSSSRYCYDVSILDFTHRWRVPPHEFDNDLEDGYVPYPRQGDICIVGRYGRQGLKRSTMSEHRAQTCRYSHIRELPRYRAHGMALNGHLDRKTVSERLRTYTT